MMKASILKQLSIAQQSHLSWVKKANSLILGSANSQNSTSFDSTECGLAIWISRDGKQLRKIKTLNKLIESIEIQHNKLHNIYLNVYQIFFMLPKHKSFLEKIFNFNSTTENEEVKEAVKLHFKDIEQGSIELLELLKKLEKRIKALPLDKIEINTDNSSLQRAI